MRPIARTLIDRALPEVPRGRTLHPSEHRVLEHAARALLLDAPLDVPPREVADNIERFLALGRSRKIWRVRLLAHLVDHLPRTTPFRRRFTELHIDQQRQVVRRYMMHERGLWAIAARIRLLVLMGAYGDARAANPETGYVPIPERAWSRETPARRVR